MKIGKKCCLLNGYKKLFLITINFQPVQILRPSFFWKRISPPTAIWGLLCIKLHLQKCYANEFYSYSFNYDNNINTRPSSD